MKRTTKKILGWAILVGVFLGVFAFAAVGVGIKVAVICFIFVGGLVGMVCLAVTLIDPD